MSQLRERRLSEHQYQHDSDLAPDSYTALRLSHATPEHLYLTSRRLFIGPIPEGWLRSHRKDWYRRHLGLQYSSRQPSFRAGENVTNQKRVTGIDGVSARPPSFPQPDDVDVEEEDTEGGAEQQQEEQHTTGMTTVTLVPRASNPGDDVPQRDRLDGQNNATSEGIESFDGAGSAAQGLQSSDPPSIGSGEENDGKQTISQDANAGNVGLGASVEPTTADGPHSPAVSSDEGGLAANLNRVSSVPSHCGVRSIGAGEPAGPSASTSALIPAKPEPAHGDHEDHDRITSGPKAIISKVKRSVGKSPPPTPVQDAVEPTERKRRQSQVRFSVPEGGTREQLLLRARMAQLDLQRFPSRVTSLKRRLTDGQIVKADRMLVRVELTPERTLPDDYDENTSQGVVTQTAEAFREYMVVCRQSSMTEGADFVLQMYKTRVIPAIDKSEDKKHATHIVPLTRKNVRANLYSPLDKTVAVWTSIGRGTRIFILRPRTAAESVEWYSFLRNILGWHRPTEIQINIPDFSINLRLANPFDDLDVNPEDSEDAPNEQRLKDAMAQEQLAATKIVERCIQALETLPEFKDLIPVWAKGKRVGLAWKRYDRLEWIHGANERKMYGTIAMMKSHDLELRPKEHYPTTTPSPKESLTEPAPVEGFLIRLTSRKGAQQRMGRIFFKRLYFATYDHYLFFSRPAKADPPPPPKIQVSRTNKIPKAHELAEAIPIVYSVNPYPIKDGQIRWLIARHERGHEKRHKDEDALEEAKRKMKNLFDSDGFIDLVNVVRVRRMHRGAVPADDNIDEGSDVDYDMEVSDTRAEDGKTDQIDDRRTFELLLNNGLVIRLQAYDEDTKKEWIKRLRQLVRYWKYRHAFDMELYRAVRQLNLEALHIDEETEAIVGQYARKWEVTKSYASPELYNMCGISCCRTIHLSGPLYRKPKRHSLFAAVHCVLIPGHLLLFSTTLRTRTSRSVPHVHAERMDSIDLSDCYLYSGLLTENDLLYRNETFDSNNPGHSALPRMWLEDSWTSRDEDVMTTFVIWQPRSKGWFRQPEASAEGGSGGSRSENERMRTGWRRVANLGKKGRTIVLKARSRAERDHWVLAVAAEIERAWDGAEDVRITTTKG